MCQDGGVPGGVFHPLRGVMGEELCDEETGEGELIGL